MAKSRPVKCPMCGESFYREDEPGYQMVSNRYYHKKCFQEKQENEKYKRYIHDYCKKLFGTGYSKRRIDTQIKELVDEGKSISGIYRTLVWHYEHNHGDISKANCGIRIVGYVYGQAATYYKKQYEIEHNQAAYLSNQQEVPEETYYISPTPIKRPTRVKLFELD